MPAKPNNNSKSVAGPLPPGSAIGILGGGQLGRMLAEAASRLGLKAVIYNDQPNSPAFDVASRSFTARFDDYHALKVFAESVSAVTYEFENVPAATADFIGEYGPIYPGAKPLAIAQERGDEKRFLIDAGVPVAAFAVVSSDKDLSDAMNCIGAPCVIKTLRFGYDGKGQRLIENPNAANAAWAELDNAPAIVEAFVPFAKEISVIASRGRAGEIALYDPSWNIHENHILHKSITPANISAELNDSAKAIASRIVDALDYVGVMGVEMFLTPDNKKTPILVNEIAPRVHNSGHWTQDACFTDQFEQHIRAICGWPLGSTARHSNAEMTNLIGNDVDDWRKIAAEPEAHLHLYGKTDTREGRKMGHVTRLSPLTS